jgi:serine/threonine protein kinase
MRVRRNFDHFEIQEELGAGGMGTVYRALDLTLNRPVALKLLQRAHSENPEYIQQFQKEAATTASINHPHVVRVYSTGQDHGLVYIAMELVDKGSLEGRMEADHMLPEVQVLSVGIQIAQGLRAALEKGLIHRDIKPGNILFSDAVTAKIVDFGLAVLQEHASHVAGEVWATPFYVAPEVVEGKPEDFRSDMYSLGATLFHAISGKPPHNVETNSMSALAVAKKAPVNLASAAPAVSSATTFALNKVLSREPGKRQQSYSEFIEHLEFARAGLLGILPESENPQTAGKGRRGYGWMTTTVSAAITVAVGVGVFEMHEQALARQRPTLEQATPPPKKEVVTVTYDKARQLLASGDAAKAEQAFDTLDAVPDTQQPEKNWTTLHAVLAEFLNGHVDLAKKHLQALVDLGLYSTDPAEKDLGAFFVDTGTKALTPEVVTADSCKNLDRENYESLDLLLYGLKDWSLGNYDEAGTLFRQYGEITPDSRYGWVADYKPVVQPYLAEIDAFHASMDAAKAADSMDTRKSALQMVKKTQGKMKLATGFAAPLTEVAKGLQQKITDEEQEIARRKAEMEAADEKVVTDAKAKITPLIQQFRPADAQAIMNAVQVTSEKAQHERDAWMKRLTWLAHFKIMLINDINTIGYAASVQKKTGTTMPGPIRRANESGVETATPFGSIIAQWTELTPESVITMAKSYARPEQPPETLGERQWLTGVYAYFAGKSKDSQELLVQASQSVPEHRDDLSLFLESSNTQAGPAPDAAPSPTTPTPAGATPTPAGATPTPAGATPTPAGATPTPAGATPAAAGATPASPAATPAPTATPAPATPVPATATPAP